MPLAVVNLSMGFLDVMTGYPPTISAAAQGFADAYAAYAQQGMFLTGSMPSLEPQRLALYSTLLGAMSQLGTAEQYASAWAAGLSAFWVGVPVVGVNAGSTVGCPGASAIVPTLLPLLQVMTPTVPQAAYDLATVLDTATRTVTAAVSLPGPPFTTVAPIS